MNNKRVLISIFLLLVLFITYGQNFAPVGAEWYYTERFFQPDIDYLRIQSTKDTVINGIDCRKLECDQVCWELDGTQFVYSNADSVFFYDLELGIFQLLYLFSSKKNESWEILVRNSEDVIDTLEVLIDSTFITIINENELRSYKVTYSIKDYSEGYNYSYKSTVIEKLGDINYLFNIPKTTGMICDANYPDGLRCYEDTEFGFYSSGIAESCDYTYKWTTMDNNENFKNITISPNPTVDFIQIETEFIGSIEIEVFNLTGSKIIGKTFTTQADLDLSNYPCGIYMLIFKKEGDMITTRKIVKE